MTGDATAIVSCGTLSTRTATSFAWAGTDIVVDAPLTGLHASHVAIGACVLNDTRREAASRGIGIDGVRVRVRGGFDVPAAIFAPIEYVLEIDSAAPESDLDDLVGYVEAIAEIPRALAASVAVTRVEP